MLWSVMLLIFKTSSVTPEFFYVFSIILSFSTCSQSFKKICTWEILGANVLKLRNNNRMNSREMLDKRVQRKQTSTSLANRTKQIRESARRPSLSRQQKGVSAVAATVDLKNDLIFNLRICKTAPKFKEETKNWPSG